MFQPLKGMRVVDLSQVLAGPFATYQMALLGAEVIKIEKPGEGDWTRAGVKVSDTAPDGVSLTYIAHNAGKKSVAVDLKVPEGLEAVRTLIRSADVLVENFKPGVAERLGLGFDAVKALKPDIVYCSISAFGQNGEMSARPAYDHVIQGMCGIMLTTGTPEAGPTKVGAPYIDYATGMNAAMAVMAGLLEVRRTGEAQRLDVAMLDTALTLMTALVCTQQSTGESPGQSGNEAWSGSPTSGAFQTADGVLMLAANNDAQRSRLFPAIGRGDILGDPRFSAPAAMRDNAPALRQILAETFATAPARHWEDVLNAVAVPAAMVRRLDQTMAEPHLAERALTTPHPVAGAHVHAPGLAFMAGGARPQPQISDSALGADTETVLKAAGLDIDALRASRAIPTD
ncbi:MAG: CoA transferase [Pseudomonadota bacterium]